jgi:flagellin
MIINHNLSAMFANRTLGNAGAEISKSTARLATGVRIAGAGDFLSGLAGSSAQIRGLNRASTNAQDGISFIQTTEGYLQETQDILHRLRELAVQAANGIHASEDRLYIQIEVSALVDEVDRIASHAQFNGMNLLTGRFSRQNTDTEITASMWFHIGANMDQRERIFIGTMTAGALGIRDSGDDSIMSLAQQDSANRAIGTLDEALKRVSKQRTDLGAYQNRLEHAVQGIDNGAENLTASDSRIMDTDMATETVEYTKNQILGSASTAMLAQANQRTRGILRLLE